MKIINALIFFLPFTSAFAPFNLPQSSVLKIPTSTLLQSSISSSSSPITLTDDPKLLNAAKAAVVGVLAANGYAVFENGGDLTQLQPTTLYTLLALSLLHITSTFLTSQISTYKQTPSSLSALSSLLFGPFQTLSTLNSPSADELGYENFLNDPPISCMIDSSTLVTSQNSILITYSLTSKPQFGHKLSSALKDLNLSTENGVEGMMKSYINQGSGDFINEFSIQQTFRDQDSLRAFQNDLPFRLFTSRIENLTEGGIGIYMVNVRNGKMGTPVHPFGPGGEGGREDAIYSSPTNIQGSGGGGMG
ncbi:hypothetical protein TrLO_g3480 [Triparma laevis f. longispina]|uniref:Uncharacterized protein n=1 Tax=Triparma laevis f. longispina TaxID=1714387 RepID=A0A9W6ZAG1_9STRA|nr:hypothetical protein TrLO_g3480 [Triparma laevis f. longispina]